MAGEDLTGDRWTYCVRASALLDDLPGQFALKRELERGHRAYAGQPSVVARVSRADGDVARRAIEAAAAAAPVWGAFPLDVRMRVLSRLHEEVKRRHDEILDVLIAEGHPRALAEWELTGCVQFCGPATVDLLTGQMHREHVEGDRRLILVRKPDGVVALSPPQNAATSNCMFGAAILAAGNALVVKAPRSTPYGVMFVMREIVAPILAELGAPAGTLNVVCGEPRQMLDAWLDSPLVDDIFFFGSSEIGIPLGEEAVRRGKKPILELAGNDGCVIWHDADLDRAADALTEAFFGSGQICMLPNYVIAHPAIADRLLDRVISLIGKIRPGYPEDPDVLLSPVLKQAQFFEFLTQAGGAGARVLAGGRRLDLNGQVSDVGAFLEPTVLRVDGLAGAREVDAVRRETFFPLLPVIVPVAAESGDDDRLFDAVVAFLNTNRYGLRNSIWTGSERRISQFATRVHNGGLLKINDSHIGFVPSLPTHGGGGLTGGPLGEANFPTLRTSHLQGISIGRDIDPRAAIFAARPHHN